LHPAGGPVPGFAFGAGAQGDIARCNSQNGLRVVACDNPSWRSRLRNSSIVLAAVNPRQSSFRARHCRDPSVLQEQQLLDAETAGAAPPRAERFNPIGCVASRPFVCVIKTENARGATHKRRKPADLQPYLLRQTRNICCGKTPSRGQTKEASVRRGDNRGRTLPLPRPPIDGRDRAQRVSRARRYR
jgi:hypothetical protein